MNIESLISPLQLRRFRSKISPPDAQGCKIWTGMRNVYGAGACAMKISGLPEQRAAHRVSYMLDTNTLIEPGLNIIHTCGNPLCQTLSHMTLVTKSDSTSAYVAKSKTHHSRWLTPEERERIRELRTQNLTLDEIRQITGYTYLTVWKTCAGITGTRPRGRKPGGKNREK